MCTEVEELVYTSSISTHHLLCCNCTSGANKFVQVITSKLLPTACQSDQWLAQDNQMGFKNEKQKNKSLYMFQNKYLNNILIALFLFCSFHLWKYRNISKQHCISKGKNVGCQDDSQHKLKKYVLI